MKDKLEKEKKVNILYVLKRIFIDNPESMSEIPGLDNIIPTSVEEERLIEELKRDIEAREKRNAFRKELEAKSSKLNQSVQKNQEVKRVNESRDDNEIQL